jgi:hypothetical protein
MSGREVDAEELLGAGKRPHEMLSTGTGVDVTAASRVVTTAGPGRETSLSTAQSAATGGRTCGGLADDTQVSSIALICKPGLLQSLPSLGVPAGASPTTRKCQVLQ